MDSSGKKPDRQMRSMASSLKANIQDGKVETIVEQFALKLPGINSHQYHAVEGEVRLIYIYIHIYNNYIVTTFGVKRVKINL